MEVIFYDTDWLTNICIFTEFKKYRLKRSLNVKLATNYYRRASN